MSVAALLLPQIATAALGDVELDGDAIDDPSGYPDDWDVLNGFPPPPGGSADVTSGLLVDGLGLDTFTGGGSKDHEDISEWRWTDGSVPDKDEIINGMAALYDGKIYFAADRYANNGDAALGFWLLQNGVSKNPDGTFEGVHAVGDLLIIAEFRQGGATAIVPIVYRWVGDGSGSDGDLDLVEVDASMAFAVANPEPEGSPWPFEPKFPEPCPEGFDQCFPTLSFFEGGLDLLGLKIDPCFSSFLIETRTSQEVEAQLKDFVLSDFSTTPTCEILGPDPICTESTHDYTAECDLGIESYLWTVSAGDAVIVGPDDEATVTVTAGSTDFTLHLETTSSLSCEGSTDKSVTVSPLPTCSIGGPDEVCAGAQNTEHCGPPGMASYQWVVIGDGTIDGPDDEQCVEVDAGTGGESPSGARAGGGGSYNVALTIVDDTGCESECDKDVTVNDPPTCSIGGPDAVCTGAQNVEHCGPPGMASYQWVVTGDGTIGGPNDEQCVDVDAGPSGSYNVALTIMDNNGCESECDKDVTINQEAPCSIGGPNEVCTGAQNVEHCGPPGMATYHWVVTGDGVIDGPDDEQCVDVDAGSSGSYNVALAVVDDNGCENECDKDVTVNPLPTCSISGPDDVCAGAQNTEHCGPAGMASYQWVVIGDGTIDGPDDERCVDVDAGSAGSYNVALTIVDGNGCESDCDKDVTVNDAPTCSIGGPDEVCADAENIEHCGPPGMASYEWIVTGDGTIDGPNDEQCVNVDAGSSGSYNVALTIVDGDGCESECDEDVTVNPLPDCAIEGPDEVNSGTQNVEYCGPAAMATYEWTVTGNGVIDGPDDEQCVDIDVDGAGTFTVHLTIVDENGCESSCEKEVTVILVSDEFCSFTQGAYGNEGGTFNGMGTLEIIDMLITSGDPLVVGKLGSGGRLGGLLGGAGRSVTFPEGTEQCIIDRLPANSSASALPAGLGDAVIDPATCQTDPPLPLNQGRFKNILLGQTIALELNVRFDPNLADLEVCYRMVTQKAAAGDDGLFGTDDDVPDPGDDGIPNSGDEDIQTFFIPTSVLDALDDNGLPQTVSSILELANCVLAGQDVGASARDVNDAVDAINRAFDECRFLIECSDAVAGASSLARTDDLAPTPLPNEFSIAPNSPNPVRAATLLSFSVPERSQIRLAVYDVKGRQVALLLEGVVPAGEHSAVWDVRKYGEVSGGVYFYRLDAQGLASNEKFSETMKMTFIK